MNSMQNGPEGTPADWHGIRETVAADQEAAAIAAREEFDTRFMTVNSQLQEGTVRRGTFVKLHGKKPKFAVEYFKGHGENKKLFRYLLTRADNGKLVGDTPAYFEPVECLESSERAEIWRVSLVWPTPQEMPNDIRAMLREKQAEKKQNRKKVIEQAKEAKIIEKMIRKCEHDVRSGKLEKGLFAREKGPEALWHYVLEQGVTVIYDPEEDEPPASDIMNRSYPLYFLLGDSLRHKQFGLSIRAKPVVPYPEQQRQQLLSYRPNG